MTTFPPFHHLTQDQVDLIREQADIAEKLGKLTSEQLILIQKQKWFKLLVPAVYGGMEAALPYAVQLEEDLARADGSLGWTVTLCAGAGWFGGFSDPIFSKPLFNDKYACLAGSGAPSGFAERVKGGYRVTGKWMHASGAQHATVFTANCKITENNFIVTEADGNEKIAVFTFLKEEVNVIQGWPYIGMKGTCSYMYEVIDLFVPATRVFTIDPAAAVIITPLYQYPFIQLAWATLAANISGMAIHFIELASVIFTQKKNKQGVLLIDLDVVKNPYFIHLQQLSSARTAFYDALNRSWDPYLAGHTADNAILNAVITTAHLLSEIARRTVDQLYPYCGLAAADPATEINRVWRDIHTAGQHSLLVFGSSK